MKKMAFLYLLVGLGLLILFTQKVLLPLVYDVAKSDAFLVDSKDQASQYPISNELTELAFNHCNNYIKSELGADTPISFSEKPLKAWTLGNYHYLINAEINISGSSKKYACRINYDKGDNADGIQNFENWSIEGIDGIEEL